MSEYFLLYSLKNFSYSLTICICWVVRPSLTNLNATILEVAYRACIEL